MSKHPAPVDLASARDHIFALLDALVAAGEGDLGIHEHRTSPHVAEAVAEWCKRNGHRIEHYITTHQHRTYEVWDIRIHHDAPACDQTISVWPLKMGTLDGKDELRSKIDSIRKEADARIQALIDGQKEAR